MAMTAKFGRNKRENGTNPRKGLNAMITIDQSHAVMSTLAVNVDWGSVDFALLQKRIKEDPRGMGRNFTRFLQAGAKMPLNMVIDMDVPSKRASKNWEVRAEDQLPNRVRGQVEWDSANTSLFLSEKQKVNYSSGHVLRKDLDGQVVYNDNVVDFYLDYPEIPTPEEWKRKVGLLLGSHLSRLAWQLDCPMSLLQRWWFACILLLLLPRLLLLLR